MIDFEKVLSIIGSICSIVGIPLTICQVLKIKSNYIKRPHKQLLPLAN